MAFVEAHLLKSSLGPGLGAKIERFAAVALVNSVLPYFLFFHVSVDHVEAHLYLRFIGGVLIALLILRDSWLPVFRKYVPWLWYLTLLWTVPVTMTYVLLDSQLYMGWALNAVLMLCFMAFFVRPVTWALLCGLGVSLGWALYAFVG